MSLPIARVTPAHQRFPRVSGDEPPDDVEIEWNGGFSPRERG